MHVLIVFVKYKTGNTKLISQYVKFLKLIITYHQVIAVIVGPRQ